MSRVDAVLGEVPATNRVEPMPAALSGSSIAARNLRAQIQAAAAASCVLIEAEPGLDPLDVARQIHALAGRPGPFVYVDCASAEPAQIERELFGAPAPRVAADLEIVDKRSALTGARGGSLFLANLTELSAAVQARLARVARDGEVHVDGEGDCRLDVRLVASAATASGGPGLRADLLRHIGRTRVALPSARQLGTLKAARERFERDYIAAVLEHHRGRMADAARTLGIQRTNLYRKARQLGIPLARKGSSA
jgi:DNA-binding NtrC family response regulator